MEEKARRQYLAMRLAAGQATDNERDEAIGTILLSLWDEDKLNGLIDRRHKELCERCKAKGDSKSDKRWLAKLVTTLVGLLGLALGFFCKQQ